MTPPAKYISEHQVQGVNSSSQIIPRWEWRHFSSDYKSLKIYFSRFDQPVVQLSDEIYFLIHNPEINIKLRHNLIDIKKRLSVDANGLEKWTPLLKIEFPVNTTKMQEFFKLSELVYTDAVSGNDVNTFVKGISQIKELVVVNISKHRYKYYVMGVAAELTKIKAKQVEFATIALEHEDADLIKQAKIELGININSNENYPAALKRYRSLT